MKVIKCTLVNDLPKYKVRMLGWTADEVCKEYKRMFGGREPKTAYLLNGAYYCVIEEAKDE